MIFLLEKWEKLLPLKLLPFFQQKCWQILDINVLKFNEMLADDVVSFERPGAGIIFFLFLLMHLSCEDDHDIYSVSCMWYTCF